MSVLILDNSQQGFLRRCVGDYVNKNLFIFGCWEGLSTEHHKWLVQSVLLTQAPRYFYRSSGTNFRILAVIDCFGY